MPRRFGREPHVQTAVGVVVHEPEVPRVQRAERDRRLEVGIAIVEDDADELRNRIQLRVPQPSIHAQCRVEEATQDRLHILCCKGCGEVEPRGVDDTELGCRMHQELEPGQSVPLKEFPLDDGLAETKRQDRREAADASTEGELAVGDRLTIGVEHPEERGPANGIDCEIQPQRRGSQPRDRHARFGCAGIIPAVHRNLSEFAGDESVRSDQGILGPAHRIERFVTEAAIEVLL